MTDGAETNIFLRNLINQKEQRKECEGKHKKARIHGGPEVSSSSVQNEENDSTFVRQMFTDINSETTPKSFKRIGKEPQGNRALKVGFASVAERDDVLGKLHKLKNKDHYLRVNITEDLTEDEGKIVKTWFERAKENNNKESEDSTTVWRLRGKSNTGFYMKKIQKQTFVNKSIS